MVPRRLALLRLIASAFACCFAASAFSAEYPAGTVKIVVPYPAGGGTDTIARLLGQKLSARWKQPVVIENRPGANGIIGTDMVAKAKPDGLTLGLVIATQAINPSLYKKLPYRSSDFAPITLVAEYPFIMTVTPSLPAKTTAEFISLAKSKPGTITFASSGIGSGPHLGAELLKQAAGLDLLHVPYKGAGPATSDLIAGHVQMMFNNMLASMSVVKAGMLRVVAVTSAQRSPALPDVPAISETIPGFSVTGWYGLIAPAATSPEIVDRIHADVRQALTDAELRSRLAEDGAIPVASSPSEFRTFLAAEESKWAGVIKAAGIQPDEAR